MAGRFFVNSLTADAAPEALESIGRNIDGSTYRLEDAQLRVQADFLFLGYIRDNGFTPTETFHPTGDLAYEDRHGMHLYGRSNDEVKILGNKLSLKHIENKIKNVLQADTAVLLACPDDRFGHILALVLKADVGLDRSQIVKKIRTRLQAHEMPHMYYHIAELPYTSSLKIDRNALLRQLPQLKAIHA